MKLTVALMGLLLSSMAIAAPATAADPLGVPVRDIAQSNSSPDRPAPRVRVRVRRDLAQQLNVSPRSLRVSEFSRETWSDGCLGLGGPAESCLAALVEGWRITITDGSQTWSYRTNLTGDQIRQEPTDAMPGELGTALPEELQQRILATAAQEAGLPVSQLTITDSTRQVWDGCMGIPPQGSVGCTKIAIDGWRVVVQGPQEYWVYHTNATGSDIRLNPAL